MARCSAEKREQNLFGTDYAPPLYAMSGMVTGGFFHQRHPGIPRLHSEQNTAEPQENELRTIHDLFGEM